MPNRLLIAVSLCSLLVATQAVFAQESRFAELKVRTSDGEVVTFQIEVDENGQLLDPDAVSKILVEYDSNEIEIIGSSPDHTPSPREEALNLAMMSIMLEAYSEGKLPILLFEGIEDSGELTSLIGLSEAQQLHIKAFMDGLEKKLEQEFGEIESVMGENLEKLSPEEFAEFESRLFGFFSQIIDEADTTVRETLTPIQLQLLREYDLGNPFNEMGLMGLVNFDAFEALDLSEEQREELKKIREEETAQWKKGFEEFAELVSDQEKIEEMMEKSVIRIARARERVREILTPEQRKRLEQLEEEIPKKLEALKAKQESEPKEDEPWKPGPDSWKPGDPIPEHLQAPEQKRRFPLK